MHGLGTLPALILPALLSRAPLSPEKVTFVWGQAVGQAMARATSVTLEGSTLVVRTTARWAREVERSSDLVLGRVQHLLGPGVVHKLVVHKLEVA